MAILDDAKFLLVSTLLKVPGGRILRLEMACRAKGLRVDRMSLQSHHLAGGHIDEVVEVLLHCADRGLACEFDRVCANDLLGISSVTMTARIDALGDAREGLQAVLQERMTRGTA